MPPGPLTALFDKNRGNPKGTNRSKCLIDFYFTCGNLIIRGSGGVTSITRGTNKSLIVSCFLSPQEEI